MYIVTINNNGVDTVINEVDTKSKNRVTGTIKNQINAIPQFDFQIFYDNQGFKKIDGMSTFVKVENDKNGKIEFEGRVLKVSSAMEEDGKIYKNVTCEGELGYLCDSVQSFSDFTNGISVTNFLNALCQNHNNCVDVKKKILCGATDFTNTISRVLNYETTLDAVKEKLIDKLGGELVIRKTSAGTRYLDYFKKIGVKSNTNIELSVNLKSITQEVDASAVITRLIPLGAKVGDTEERLTVVSVNNGKNYIDTTDTGLINKYGYITKTQEWDDITTASALMAKAKTYLNEQNKLKKAYNITALDLSSIDMDFDSFEVGNTHHVVNPLMGLDEDLRIIGKTIDISDPTKNALQIGDKFSTATNLTALKTKELATSIKNMQIQSNALIDSKVHNATQLITGAVGGNVVIDTDTTTGKPRRILIMDTDNIDTCSSCIQLNYKGIGFWKSSDGGSAKNGPYKNAWTIDGNLVAEFVTALNLTGLTINNGNGTFKVSKDGTVIANKLYTDNITILGGKIDIMTSSDKDSCIKLRYNEWALAMSPLEITLTNSTIPGNIKLQAGMACFCNGDTIKCSILPETGAISTDGGINSEGSITTSSHIVASDLLIDFNNNGTKSSLKTEIQTIKSRIGL